MEDNILCVLSYHPHFQTIKQNLFAPWKIGSIKKSRYWFCPSVDTNLFTPWEIGSIKKSRYWFCPSVDTFVWYLLQLVVLLKPDLNCSYIFVLSRVDKVTTGT